MTKEMYTPEMVVIDLDGKGVVCESIPADGNHFTEEVE